jgi:predicted phosphate transport protein (TIGR00153 family)
MILEKIFSQGKKERQVTEAIEKHIQLLCTACRIFKNALERNDRNLLWEVIELERDADAVRRDVIAHIYEGAFLPYIRPDLCKFVEIVDEVFDELKDTAFYGLDCVLPEPLRDESIRVALLNFRMCEMLLISFEAMIKGEDLRDKILGIRIYEKKIDDIKLILFKDAEQVPTANFWEGKKLSDLLSGLTMISDFIEDASDHLQIINVSTR